MLIYNTNNANKKIENFFLLHKKISRIISLNKNFDIFVSSKINYNNFDYIQNNIEQVREDMSYIQNSELFNQINNDVIQQSFEDIALSMEKKIDILNRIVSRSAVLNNSYRYIQKLNKEIHNKEVLSIYSDILSLEYNPEIDIQKLTLHVQNLQTSNQNEVIFKAHANIILGYYNNFTTLKEEISRQNLSEKLNSFEGLFTKYVNSIMHELKGVIWLLICMLFLALLAFLYYTYLMLKKQLELNRFKKAVQSSDNIVVITDRNRHIKYVNEAFERVTGYTKEEVLGKKPSLLKSHQKSDLFYDNLHKTIEQGSTWKGEFINRSKNGQITYEKASITPILNEKGEIEEFLAIKLDVTKEKETQRLLKEKEELLSEQSKMFAMREMLDSIAHQWRQPLSTISTAASGIKLNKEFNTLSDEKFDELTDVIVENTASLSKTIDGFKNYFNTKNEKTIFYLHDSVQKVLDLLSYKLDNQHVEVIRKIDESLKLEGLENELIESFMNIIKNTQEAFEENKIEQKYIFIHIKKEKDAVYISIKDNALGIKDEVIEHVFEPYFTTKHQKSGTGLGLYMVYEIITKHFQGIVNIKNVKYTYNKKKYKGAKITMIIPLKHLEERVIL